MSKSDPKLPLPAEVGYYLAGEPAFAIRLYAARRQVSELTAEDTIRAHLADVGMKLPPVHIPRYN